MYGTKPKRNKQYSLTFFKCRHRHYNTIGTDNPTIVADEKAIFEIKYVISNNAEVADE